DKSRRIAVLFENDRCDKRALETMRTAVSHDASKGEAGRAVGLAIVRDAPQISLHLFGGPMSLNHSPLFAGERQARRNGGRRLNKDVMRRGSSDLPVVRSRGLHFSRR